MTRPAPRKSPRQHRSRELVDALLEATARILAEDGSLARATTNRIAEVAGVSVGSLYQYFPNKQALVAALVERRAERSLEEIGGAVAARADRPIAEIVATCVRSMIEVHRRDRALYVAMLSLVGTVGSHEQVRALAAQGRARLRDLLEAHRSELREGLDPELAAFVLGHTLEGLVHAAVLEEPERLEAERFEQELVQLLLGYLRG